MVKIIIFLFIYKQFYFLNFFISIILLGNEIILVNFEFYLLN